MSMKREAAMIFGTPGTDTASSRTDHLVFFDPKRCAGHSMKDANHFARDSAREISPPPHHTLEHCGPHVEQRQVLTFTTWSCSHLCSPLPLQQ